MQTFIIVSLMILVIVILILYVHKVIKYSHLEEDLRTVFNNLTNINAYINKVSETQSQSPNTEIKETDITNVNTDPTIKEITDESDKDIEKADVDYMRNGGNKCIVCINFPNGNKDRICDTCTLSETRCNFVQNLNIKDCANCVYNENHKDNTCENCDEYYSNFELHVE